MNIIFPFLKDVVIAIAEEALNREEADIAGLLIPSLAQLPNLPSSTLALLLAYLRYAFGGEFDNGGKGLVREKFVS